MSEDGLKKIKSLTYQELKNTILAGLTLSTIFYCSNSDKKFFQDMNQKYTDMNLAISEWLMFVKGKMKVDD